MPHGASLERHTEESLFEQIARTPPFGCRELLGTKLDRVSRIAQHVQRANHHLFCLCGAQGSSMAVGEGDQDTMSDVTK